MIHRQDPRAVLLHLRQYDPLEPTLYNPTNHTQNKLIILLLFFKRFSRHTIGNHPGKYV